MNKVLIGLLGMLALCSLVPAQKIAVTDIDVNYTNVNCFEGLRGNEVYDYGLKATDHVFDITIILGSTCENTTVTFTATVFDPGTGFILDYQPVNLSSSFPGTYEGTYFIDDTAWRNAVVKIESKLFCNGVLTDTNTYFTWIY